MDNLGNRKLVWHLVAYDANNPSSLLLGMVSVVILTDVWARGGKVLWGQGSYTRPEARRYNVMIKLLGMTFELCKKDPELRIFRTWTNNAHVVDIAANKFEIS